MDPQATLREALDALAELDSTTATERFRDLAEWFDKGGFLPYVYQNGRSGLSGDFYVPRKR